MVSLPAGLRIHLLVGPTRAGPRPDLEPLEAAHARAAPRGGARPAGRPRAGAGRCDRRPEFPGAARHRRLPGRGDRGLVLGMSPARIARTFGHTLVHLTPSL